MWTSWQGWQSLKSFHIDVHYFGGRIPDFLTTGFAALEMMQGAVTFNHLILSEPCFLELAINIGSEDEIAVRLARADFEQLAKARVGRR